MSQLFHLPLRLGLTGHENGPRCAWSQRSVHQLIDKRLKAGFKTILESGRVDGQEELSEA